MFASTMHSIADTVNQLFVFGGSILAEREATRRFPSGFGRVIHLFCMLAVIVVTIMAYETIREGWYLVHHPMRSGGFWINLAVLVISIGMDGYVLIKAMKEIAREARLNVKGLKIATAAFRNVKKGRSLHPPSVL